MKKDIVLHHGSLEELNSVSDTQFKVFGMDPVFLSGNVYDYGAEIFEELKKSLRSEYKNLDGLVNLRSGAYYDSDVGTGYFAEGTPIVKVRA